MKEILIFLFFILFIPLCSAQQEPDFHAPFQLLLDTNNRSCIIICGIKNTSDQSLLMLAQHGIAAFAEQIQKKNSKIAVFTDKKPLEENFWNTVLKKETKDGIKYCSLFGSNDSDKDKHCICTISNKYLLSDNHIEDLYHTCHTLITDQTACLILIDDYLFQQSYIQRNIYNKFEGKNKIILYDPYKKKINNNYKPVLDLSDYIIPSTYFFGAIVLGIAYYCTPDLGTSYMHALAYK